MPFNSYEEARAAAAGSETVTLDEDALAAAHVAIEDELVDWRDRGMFEMAANGFTINYADGEPATGVRIGSRNGLRIAIRAYLRAACISQTL